MSESVGRSDDGTTDSTRQAPAGARSLPGGPVRKAPIGWLPWVALLLLGLLGLAALLVARNVGDAGDAPGVDLTDEASAKGADPADPVANPAPTTKTTTAPRTTTSAAAAGGSPPTTAAPVAPGSPGLRAGGQAILPLPAGGLAALTGRAVEGANVRVESVVGDEAFWVGENSTNRVLVYLIPVARTTKGESPFQVVANQRIKVTGALKPLPADTTPFGVSASEGLDQLRQQGQFVEATAIALGS